MYDCRVHDEVRYSAQPSPEVACLQSEWQASSSAWQALAPRITEKKERELTIYPWLEDMFGIESADVRSALKYVQGKVPRQSLVL